MAKIGLKKAFYAPMVSDEEGAVTYANPVALQYVQQVGVSPRVSKVQVPGDDTTVEDLNECLGADLTIQRVEFEPEEEAILLGRLTDEEGGVFGGTTDNPPYVAFGYKRTFKNSNLGLYVWILKTKFAPSNSTADTKPTDNITPQYDTMSASSITRQADGQWIYSIKSSDPNFEDTFFTRATLEKLASGAAVADLVISSISPDDDDVDVAVDSDIVITFNNKIAVDAITVIKNDGTLVVSSKVWNSEGKVLTISPNTDLDSTSTYLVAINGVKDIYGQTLTSVAKNFLTV